jgi:hypothetical protein
VLLIHVRTTASCHRKIVANGLGFSDGLRGDHGPSASRGAFADVNQRPCPQGRAPPTDDGQSRDQRLPASKASHRRLIDPNCPVCFGHGGASEILLETFCGHIPLLESRIVTGADVPLAKVKASRGHTRRPFACSQQRFFRFSQQFTLDRPVTCFIWMLPEDCWLDVNRRCALCSNARSASPSWSTSAGVCHRAMNFPGG